MIYSLVSLPNLKLYAGDKIVYPTSDQNKSSTVSVAKMDTIQYDFIVRVSYWNNKSFYFYSSYVTRSDQVQHKFSFQTWNYIIV